MKRWAVLTVAAYLLMLAALTLMAAAVAFWPDFDLTGIGGAFGFIAVWAAVMGLGQGLLLLVPIGSVERRPRPRRKLLVPVIVTTFFMSMLVVAAALCMVLAIWGDSLSDDLAVGGFIGLTLVSWVFGAGFSIASADPPIPIRSPTA